MTEATPYHYICPNGCPIVFATNEPIIGAGHRCAKTGKETAFVLEKRKPTRGKGAVRGA